MIDSLWEKYIQRGKKMVQPPNDKSLNLSDVPLLKHRDLLYTNAFAIYPCGGNSIAKHSSFHVPINHIPSPMAFQSISDDSLSLFGFLPPIPPCLSDCGPGGIKFQTGEIVAQETDGGFRDKNHGF